MVMVAVELLKMKLIRVSGETLQKLYSCSVENKDLNAVYQTAKTLRCKCRALWSRVRCQLQPHNKLTLDFLCSSESEDEKVL